MRRKSLVRRSLEPRISLCLIVEVQNHLRCREVGPNCNQATLIAMIGMSNSFSSLSASGTFALKSYFSKVPLHFFERWNVVKHLCERFAPSEASCHGQIGTALDNGILGRGQAEYLPRLKIQWQAVPLPRKRRANKGRGCIRKVASCSRKLRVVFGNLCSKYVRCIRVWKVVFGNWRVVCGKWYSQTRYRGFGNREQTWPQSWNPFFPDRFSAQKMAPCQQQQLEDKLKLISRSIHWSAGVVDWSLMNMSKLISHSIYCLEGVVDLIRYEDRLKALSCNIPFNTSSTAQGGGGSFKNRKPIGEVGCCESGMAERSHWWTERWLMSPLFLSLSLTIYLPTYLSTYVSIDLSIYLPIFLSIYLSVCLSIYLTIYLSIYLSLSLFHLSSCLPVYLSIYLSVYLSLSLSLSSVYLSTCLSVYVSIYISVYLSTCLSVVQCHSV